MCDAAAGVTAEGFTVHFFNKYKWTKAMGYEEQ